MALLTPDLVTFLEIHEKEIAADKKGTIPIVLSDFTPGNQVALTKIISVIKPDFEPNNLFAAKVEYGMVMQLLGFSLALQDGKLSLIFGSLMDEPKCNCVEVEYVNGKLVAGKAKILISATDPTKEGSAANFMLSLETPKDAGGVEKWRIPLYGHIKDGVSYDDLEDASDLEEISNFFKPFGGMGVKLRDFVRPFIGQAVASRNKLPKPIVLSVKSWELKEAPADNPEFGESVLFELEEENVPKAQLEDGTIVEKPLAVYINAKRPGLGVAAQMMMNEAFAKRALDIKAAGGRIEIWITEVNAKEPDRKMPRHQIKLVPAKDKPAIAPSTAEPVAAAFTTVVAHAESNGKKPLEAVPVGVAAANAAAGDDEGDEDDDDNLTFGAFS